MPSTAPILMTEEYWANSQLSVVRHFGHISVFGHPYTIVNKDGLTIFELSEIAEQEGRTLAIEPGEPCDLVRNDYIPIYRAVGRDEFMRLVKETTDLKQLRTLAGLKPKTKKTPNPL
ncbi:MAG: hypothetical protein HUK14_06125 [Muribaculaceae bacterium]|nr:hypothetical protein [Muribaculaceae bacterium]